MIPASLLRLARRDLALFALCACCAAGCLASSSSPGDDPGQGGGGSDTTDGGGDPVRAREAFFTLHGSDLRGANWPADYAGYSLFVCDPSLPPASLARIRADVPGAVLLAYTNAQDIPLGSYSENPYFAALEAAFDSSFCMIDLSTGRVVRLQGYTGVPGSGEPHYVLREESAEALAAFHRDVTMAAGFDGMYVDQCNAAYPSWRKTRLLAQTTNFDADGDGAGDRIEDVELQYRTWRPYFTRRLREELGEARVLVANSGGALGDPELNGITLEGVGDRFTVAQARSHLAGQEAVSRAPFTAVLWATTEASRNPSRQLAAELGGVHYGVIDAAD